MIPRLAPRRSSERPLSLNATGVENSSPFLDALEHGDGSSACTDKKKLSPRTRAPLDREVQEVVPQLHPAQAQAPAPPVEPPRRREVLSNNNNNFALHPPHSPSPALVEQHPSTSQLLEPFKSPLSSEGCWLAADKWSCSLTPPATGPRPLMVSAKRLGKDVRRKHSKRRRCQSRRKLQPPNNGDVPSSSNNHGAYCLWKDANAPPRQEYYSSSEEEQGGLPFLFSQQNEVPPQKQTQQYWEYCYGKMHTTTAKITDLSATTGWSANRKPPSKGCLSHTKLRQNQTPAANNIFKTPPTSPEDEEEASNVGNSSHPNKKRNRVQFGSPQAAEYEVDAPTAQLTPLPSDVTRQRYSMDQKEVKEEDEEMTIETKRNSAMLAEWEEELQPLSSRASRRRQQRKNRRDSSIFDPSPTGSLLNSDDEEKDREYDRQEQVPSPSTIVMNNLASLCVDSPAAASGQEFTSDALSAPPTLTPLSTGSEDSSSSDNFSPPESLKTVEFAISLESLNSSGAAMDSTPPRLDIHIPGKKKDKPSTSTVPHNSPTASSTEMTPPSLNMSLDAIHSFGGALDHSSPPKMMTAYNNSSDEQSYICLQPGGSTDSNIFDEGYFEGISTSSRINIVEMLLKNPSADQSWEVKDIFQNLATKMKAMKNSWTSSCITILESIGPNLDGVLSCFEDLIEQARFCAGTKSNTKFKLTSTQAPLAHRIATREWQDLEIEFVLELSEALERNSERAVQLLQNASSLLNKRIPQIAVSKQKPKRRRKKLESEIALLEKEIYHHKKSKQVLEAVEAPSAALQCQAVWYIGVCGFRLDEYTGTCLQLSYEHPITGIESQFCFELSMGIWKASYTTYSCMSNSILLPATHPAAKFHKMLAKWSFEDNYGCLLSRLQSLELPDAILLLSRWLGLLDVAVNDLANLSVNYPISVEWPVVSVSLPLETSENGGILRLIYDRKAIETIRPSNSVLSRFGKRDLDLFLPTGANFIQHLVSQAISASE